MVDREAMLDHARLVVISLDEKRVVLITDVLAFWRVKLEVVVVPRIDADAPAGEASDHFLIGYVDE